MGKKSPKLILYVLSETLADIKVIYDAWKLSKEEDVRVFDNKLRAIDHVLSLYSILSDSEFNFLQERVNEFCLGPDFIFLDSDQGEKNVVNHSFGHALRFLLGNFEKSSNRRLDLLQQLKSETLELIKYKN